MTEPDLFEDPHMRDAALLGAIEGDLLRRGYPQVRQLMALTAGLMDRIEVLEQRPMTEAKPFTSTHIPEFERLCREGGTQIEREIALLGAFTEAMKYIRKVESE